MDRVSKHRLEWEAGWVGYNMTVGMELSELQWAGFVAK